MEKIEQKNDAPNVRQQDKIIKIVEGGDANILNEPSATVSDDERNSFFEKARAGTITEETLDSGVVRNIGAPFSGRDGVENLHEQLQNNQRVQRDVGEAIRSALYDKHAVRREDWQPTAEELGRFVQMYPTPRAFDETFLGNRLQELQAAFEQEQSPRRRDDLKTEISLQKWKAREMYPRLRAALYGKRNEYWEQSKLLLREAKKDTEASEETKRSPESVTSPQLRLENREAPIIQPPVVREQPPTPETTEFLKNHVVERDLSYQDAALPDEVKQRTLDFSRKSESAGKYAESIVQLSKRTNLEMIRQEAKELVKTMVSEAERIGVPVSPYGKSVSWAMWDIGKQNYFFTHEAENNPAYEIGDPLTSEAKREEIIDRQLGWEAYNVYHSNAPTEWKQKITSNRRFAKALELLNKPPKENRTLSSKDLAELGKYLKQKQ